MKYKCKMLVLALFLSAFTSYAQRGIGNSNGMANKAIPIDLVALKGTVKNVKEEPCHYTTGTSVLGTHLMVTTHENKMVNVHLGPTWAMAVWVEGIENQEIDIVAFRTEKLPENHYIAKEFEWDGQRAQLRDGYLKPFWANRYGKKELW